MKFRSRHNTVCNLFVAGMHLLISDLHRDCPSLSRWNVTRQMMKSHLNRMASSYRSLLLPNSWRLIYFLFPVRAAPCCVTSCSLHSIHVFTSTSYTYSWTGS